MWKFRMCINKKTVKKATDSAFSVSSPKFLFPIYPLAGKNKQQVESPNLLASLHQNTTDE